MVSYGGGANSTALLIGLHQHRIPVDLILFADTGAEHPHTYAYLDVMDAWLKGYGMPPITRVYKTTRDGKRLTLEDECLQSCSLPSIAYGFKRCSLKHKIGPQEKFCNHYPTCQKEWAAGKRVVKFIGYDAGEGYRSDKVLLGDLADRKYSKWYPLMEWGWTRDDCIRQIEAAGLPQPGKSSCFFCPSMKPDEITALREQHPDLFRRALALEDNARKNLKTVKGLGRNYSWFIGYDAGEGYRSDKVLLGDLADRKYSKWYPLMEWGWTRDDCIRQIEAAGLPQPGKSSCFFCPSMKPDEITALREQHPDLFRRALALEDNARKNLKTVKGLGRNYSWRERFGKEFCTHGNG